MNIGPIVAGDTVFTGHSEENIGVTAMGAVVAINALGRLIAEFPVEGATNEDWEDITIDDAGNLYIGDIGNNKNERDDLRVYRVPEPDPFAGPRTARTACPASTP